VLERVMNLARQGALRPKVAARMPLSQAAKAHLMMESEQTPRGRIVLDIPAIEATDVASHETMRDLSDHI
jgi:D-arabinose 1-dehydrogenase-like Zn-dependent alcohol dehydrogenase